MTHRPFAVARLVAALGLAGTVYAGALGAQARPGGDDGRTRGAPARKSADPPRVDQSSGRPSCPPRLGGYCQDRIAAAYWRKLSQHLVF